jgi:hypothetical protein
MLDRVKAIEIKAGASSATSSSVNTTPSFAAAASNS